jgi:hypothetical protein
MFLRRLSRSTYFKEGGRIEFEAQLDLLSQIALK